MSRRNITTNKNKPKKEKKSYTKKDLAYGISHMEGLPFSQCERIVNSLIDQMILALCSGKSLNIPKLGKMSPVYRKGRIGRRPKDLEPIMICPKIRVRLLISPFLKDRLQSLLENYTEEGVLIKKPEEDVVYREQQTEQEIDQSEITTEFLDTPVSE